MAVKTKRLRCAWEYTEGNTSPPLGIKITDSNGAKDLTGYTITLYLDRDGHCGDVISKTGIINDPLSGKVQFAWVAGDLICGPEYQTVMVELDDGAGGISTLPRFCIRVQKRLQVTP